ncbi:MAG: D-alanine--D-alanine ligase [Rhodothermales bacterium]|nr:D-alanine--D-alanine ligase [Rhodothermales bacterium]
MPLQIGLVYDRFGDAPPPPGAPPDWDAEYEPEATIQALEEAIRALGHTPVRVGNVRALLDRVCRGGLALDAAVNIAESYGSRNREAHAPVLLELAGVPCLGSDALTLSLSLDKAWTKTVVGGAGVPVPAHAVVRAPADLDAAALPPLPVMVKPRYEGTAKGIAPTSRCDTADGLRAEVDRQARLYRQDLLVEAFVAGAEYTVAVVGGGEPGGPPEALPVLQRATERTTGIGLHALERHEDPDRPFAYDVAGGLDAELEARLHRLALRAFDALECHDYARADFRLDSSGEPLFLEINPLPTFAPDGTFAIIAELSGRAYPDFLADVLDRALRRIRGGA